MVKIYKRIAKFYESFTVLMIAKLLASARNHANVNHVN